MQFAEDQEVIQAVAPQRPDQALHAHKNPFFSSFCRSGR
jgi:hypothetical protein